MSNNVDSDKTAHYKPSHLDLYCLQKAYYYYLWYQKRYYINTDSCEGLLFSSYQPISHIILTITISRILYLFYYTERLLKRQQFSDFQFRRR